VSKPISAIVLVARRLTAMAESAHTSARPVLPKESKRITFEAPDGD